MLDFDSDNPLRIVLIMVYDVCKVFEGLIYFEKGRSIRDVRKCKVCCTKSITLQVADAN